MKTSATCIFISFMLLLLNRETMNSANVEVLSSLNTLNIDGHFSFDNNSHVAKDFGNRYFHSPLSVLHPLSVSDIAKTVSHIYKIGQNSNIKIAARGHGHSLQGQSQALEGIVIQMELLKEHKTRVFRGENPFVEASGGELWINVLQESLKYGLAPKSWTDYLHLTIGGTLSNAGVSGQAFRHGPQISNVHELEIVTGKGAILKCSEKQNADLFYGVLGGLGQFGIITKARIALEPAPKMVKWIRVLYTDFKKFTEDQEMLISKKNTFDYIEGFIIINRTGILNNWRSSFNPQDPVQASKFKSDGRILFCLEMTKNFNPYAQELADKEVEDLLSQLRYISSTLFQSEVTYLEFLNRVHTSELHLRSKGLWDVPHPWLNLIIPKSKIHSFAKEVIGKILTDSNNGPILMYPVHRSKWDNRTSVVLPDDEVLYFVGLLSSASFSENAGLAQALKQNEKILDFCKKSKIGVKQYLPHYNTQEEWMEHFGSKWQVFLRRKQLYDPLKILAPGHRIFQKAILSL